MTKHQFQVQNFGVRRYFVPKQFAQMWLKSEQIIFTTKLVPFTCLHVGFGKLPKDMSQARHINKHTNPKCIMKRP